MIIAFEADGLVYLYDSLEAAADDLEITCGCGIDQFEIYDETGIHYIHEMHEKKKWLGLYYDRWYVLTPQPENKWPILQQLLASAKSIERGVIGIATVEDLKQHLQKAGT